MTTELSCLVWAILLGLVHVLATGAVTTAQFGVAYGLSSREERKTPAGMGGRIHRAFSNYMQTFPFFAAAVLAAQALDRHGWSVAFGAQLYLWSRIAYVLLYAFDVKPIRSIAFGTAMAGIVLVLWGLR